MKRSLIVLLMSLICSTSFAKIKITSGSNDFLKSNSTAVLVFDYSEATWEEDELYKSWCGDEYEERVNISVRSFIRGFNENSSKLKIKQEDTSARYRIIFKVENLEQKNGGRGWGRFYVLCYGIITIQDIETGKDVCVLSVKKEAGSADYSQNDRIASCFNEIGELVADF